MTDAALMHLLGNLLIGLGVLAALGLAFYLIVAVPSYLLRTLENYLQRRATRHNRPALR
jgi:hypothetical protein